MKGRSTVLAAVALAVVLVGQCGQRLRLDVDLHGTTARAGHPREHRRLRRDRPRVRGGAFCMRRTAPHPHRHHHRDVLATIPVEAAASLSATQLQATG